MKRNKIFISFIIIILFICNFTITYANAMTILESLDMDCVRARKAILISKILIVVQIIIFIILTFLLKRGKINKKKFLIFLIIIFICIAITVGVNYHYKKVYSENYKAFQNYLDFSGWMNPETAKNDYNNRLNEISADNVEIEKKYLIDKNKIPFNLSKTNIYKIEQTYISFSPEIRVRKINDGKSYSFAVKTNMTKDGLIRNEMEESITEKEYNTLVKKKEGNTVYKTRYQFLHEGNIYAIDIFEGNLLGLAYLEIEFTSKEEAENFIMPDWVLEDVTEDIRYKNSYLARYGIPEKQ